MVMLQNESPCSLAIKELEVNGMIWDPERKGDKGQGK
jgi:hypothetical protein